jgi:uncharacterized MAPEG superfamily protein
VTIAYWCVLAAIFMPIVWAGVAKTGVKGYDNARPREFLAQLQGRAARANHAQANAYEAFPPFAAGVIIAHATGGADQATIDTLALVFIAARIAYGLAYITDRATVRSLVWLVGFAATVGLYFAAA